LHYRWPNRRRGKGNRQVEALIVRGISDLIEDKHLADAANSQEIAARHASAFAFEVLANLCLEEQAIVSQKRVQSALEEGTTYLERGQIALLHGDYTTAKQHLINAVVLLSEDQASEKSAQRQIIFPTLQGIKRISMSYGSVNPG
jgi:hypothetical protein